MFLRRRRLIAATGLAAASAALPRVAIGQADRRPSIAIAVQQISNSASLEPLREQSNVGSRTFSFIFETLIMQNLMGQLENKPGLAESWKRIDERTVELALRKGVKFHNGDEMTADELLEFKRKYTALLTAAPAAIDAVLAEDEAAEQTELDLDG